MVAYSQGNTLWIRDLDRVEPRQLPGTQEALNPFWSPDSKFVGYRTLATLKKVSAQGGPSSTICEIPQRVRFAATWGTGGTIVFATARGLRRARLAIAHVFRVRRRNQEHRGGYQEPRGRPLGEGMPHRLFVEVVSPAFEQLVARGRIAAWGITGIGVPTSILEVVNDDLPPAAV